MSRDRASRQAGVSMVELLVVLAVIGVTMGAATVYLAPAAAPHRAAAALLDAHMRMVRSRAIATTSAYRVTPVDDATLQGAYSSSCSSATWTVDETLDLELPDESGLADTTWTVCFTPRGAASSNVTIDVHGRDTLTGRVEVLLGGGVRIVE